MAKTPRNDKSEITPQRLKSMLTAAEDAIRAYRDVSPVVNVSAAELHSLVDAAAYALLAGWTEDAAVDERERLLQ